MKKISLVKVTGFVITAAFASNFVNAQDKIEINKSAESVQSDVIQVEKEISFPKLIKTLDTNKNGKLSESEVSAKHINVLQGIFTKVDANQDKEIDEAEFNLYFVDIKSNTVNIAKSES